MGILKKISKQPWGTTLIAKVIEFYVRFVWLTSRWKEIDAEHMHAAWENDTPIMGVFWHGRLLMMLQSWRGRKRFNMLISNHSDGSIIAKATTSFGFGWVAGSSNRQAAKAVRKLVDVLKKGECAGITPDGPRGPKYKAKVSSIAVARLANVDIHPVTFSAKRGIFARSWDRFFVPFPFNSGVFVCAEPVRVAGSNRSDEELRQELEDKLNAITRRADELCGRLDPTLADIPIGNTDCESIA